MRGIDEPSVSDNTAPEVELASAELPEAPADNPLLPAAVAYAGGAGQTGTSSSVPLIWWLLALAAVIGTALAAIVLVRRERGDLIEGYTIDEEDLDANIDRPYTVSIDDVGTFDEPDDSHLPEAAIAPASLAPRASPRASRTRNKKRARP